MAITVDWDTKIISVLKADMTLVQASPTEIRELNLNSFRLTLKDLEANSEGIPFIRTHNHSTEVSLGGLTYARVIEIINGYTVTFEDGQYAINLTGANSNVGDVVNVNQVSVRSQNSAGMTSSPDIEYSSFNGGVTVDQLSPYTGTIYPTGTPRMPVNNLADAKLIAEYRGFNTIFVTDELLISAGDAFQSYIFKGNNTLKTHITVLDDAFILNCEFTDAVVTGVLDGSCLIKNGIVIGLRYVQGFIYTCVLSSAAPIVLDGNDIAHFLDCFSSVPGTGTPTIDMGGSGQALAMRNYNGGIKLINKSGPEAVSIDLNSGQVKLDLATVTNGTIVVRGPGKVVDSSNNDEHLPSGQYGSLTLINETLNTYTIVERVWGYER